MEIETIANATLKACSTGKQLVKAKEAQAWNQTDNVSVEDIDEIFKKLTEFTKKQKEFLSKMIEWKKTRLTTISKLEEIADECDKLHRDCNIANVAGSSVGAAGGLMVLGGIIMAPFTFGASLGVSVAGAVTGVAGAATNITTSIVESSKMKGKCETAQNCIYKDKTKTKNITKIVESLMGYLEILDSLQEKMKKIGKLQAASIALDSTALAATSVSSVAGIAKSVQALKLIRSFSAAEISLLKECPKLLKSLKAFKSTALVAGKLATFLAVVGLGVSVWEIVKTSQDIHNGSGTEAGKKFRENAISLKEQMNKLCEIESKLKVGE